MALNKTALIGKRFGMLKVVSWAGLAEKSQRSLWACICDCGRISTVIGSNLNTGNTSSCGCMEGARTHGHTQSNKHTPTYKSWSMMLVRCSSQIGENYALYGGRGITVCEEWRVFENFLADMGPRPPGTSIDRIDVNGNYEPGNCRWATAKQQARNMRVNNNVEHGGKTRCLSEWAELLGIKRPTLAGRLRRGWSIEEAFTTKVKGE